MPEQKENKEESKYKWAYKYIVMGAIALAPSIWSFAKDIFFTGAEEKSKQLVINITVSSPETEEWARGLAKDEIMKTMNNPSTWLTVLSSDFLKPFMEDKMGTLRKEMNENYNKLDSMSKAQINNIMSVSGLRNEEFEQKLGELLRWWDNKTVNTVHASF